MNAGVILKINWDEIDPKFNFAAISALGSVMLFTERPETVDYGWHGVSFPDVGYTYICYGDVNLKKPVHWTQTLTERPAKVE